MTNRERIIELADEIGIANANHHEGANIFTYHEDAAALRELDLLLSDFKAVSDGFLNGNLPNNSDLYT